jgi:hypothetical protein
VVPESHPEINIRDKFTPMSLEAAVGETKPDRTICGLKSRVAWGLLVVITLVVIAAVVGGVVGSRQAQKGSSPDPGKDEPPDPSGSLAEGSRALAASTSSTDKAANLQVFYQDLETTNILYRLVWDDEPRDEQRLDLPIPPNQATPLAVAATNQQDPVMVSLFYISTKSSAPVIVEAALECRPGMARCDTKSNQVISDNITTPIAPNTALAALRIAGHSSVRVYYQAYNELLWVLSRNGGGDEAWVPQRIGGPALAGSGLAVYGTGRPEPNVHLACVWKATTELRLFGITDVLGASGSREPPYQFSSSPAL